MTQVTKYQICRATARPIPEATFHHQLLQGIEAWLTDLIPKEKVRKVFLWVLPQLVSQGAQSAGDLYATLPADAGAVLGSSNALKHHLLTLSTLGILQKEGAKFTLTATAKSRLEPIAELVQKAEYKELLTPYVGTITTLLCIIARGVRDQAGALTETQVFSLAGALIQTGVQLAAQDLKQHGILQQRCNRCLFPFELEPSAEGDDKEGVEKDETQV